MSDLNEIYVGHAETDSVKGWFVGQFLDSGLGVRRQTAVEVKWGIHPPAEARGLGWVRYKAATTISVLIQGILQVWFRADGQTRDIVMQRDGDYYILPPGIDHRWRAHSFCVADGAIPICR